MQYAKDTSVSVARSRAEIEDTVVRYGAEQFGSAMDNANGRAMVKFKLNNLLIRFDLKLPGLAEFQTKDGRGHVRSIDEARRAQEQAQRQRWRALALCIKAKLEAVESGIVEFEQEFLANIVLPSGQTFAEYAMPQLRQAIEDGRMPKNLLEWQQ